MSKVDYTAEAELFPGRSRTSGGALGYRRFDSAALAIKFAIEELPNESLVGAILEVGDDRFGSAAIRQLYESNDYPLIRDTRRTSLAMKTPQKSSARRNAEELMNQAQRRDSNLKLEKKQSYEAMAAKTQRLRELRLVKEATDREADAAAPSGSDAKKAKGKRSRQT